MHKQDSQTIYTQDSPVPVCELVGGHVATELTGLRDGQGCYTDPHKDINDDKHNKAHQVPNLPQVSIDMALHLHRRRKAR